MQLKSLVLFTLLLSSFHSFSQFVKPRTEILKYPELNKNVESEIGSTLVEKEKKEVYEGLKLNTPIEKKLGLGGVYFLSKSDLYLYKSDDKWKYYITVNPSLGYKDALIPSYEKQSYATISISKDGKVYRLNETVLNDEKDLTKAVNYASRTLKEKPDFTPINVTLKKDVSFKQEFIYNGKIDNSVKFIYREFVNDLARPSFTQEIQYDLNESPIVGFKGLKIKILSASNTLIKYQVLSHFND